MQVKQCTVIEFLTAETLTPTEIHRRFKCIYGNDAINRSTVNRWVIKFCFLYVKSPLLTNKILCCKN